MPTLDIGSVHLDLLLDSSITSRGDSVFAPASREEWSAIFETEEEGVVRSPVRPLLITGPDGYTLVDTGFGDSTPAPNGTTLTGQTLSELAVRGVTPDDVVRVIITHAHGDHFLGNTLQTGSGRKPTYPNAEYIVQKADSDTFHTQSALEWDDYFGVIADAGKLRLIEGDTRISGTISCRLTQGHTIGHQSVVVTSGGESACYLGDLAIKALNLRRPEWGPDWAWSRAKDIENRQAIREWAADSNAVLILLHDERQPFVRVERDGDEFVVVDA